MTDDTEEIVGSYCDCPYDWGDYCKHQAAAFFALREKTVGIDIRTRKLPSNTGKKVDLKEIVSNLKKDELITIILDISREYHEIEKELLFKYAPAKDEISYSKKLIREYINRSKRHGFIEWRNVSEAIRGANMTLEKAHEKLAEGELETAILLSIAVLSIVVDMIQYCDDSSGYVGDVIAESIEIIHETVSLGINKMNASQQRKLFSTIMKEAFNKRYEGWSDWRISLLRICIYFSGDDNLRIELEKQFDIMMKSTSDTSWSAQYDIQNVKLLQLELIERNEGAEKALQFIHNNIQYSPFREKEIVHLMEKAEYQEVVRLCEEGEELDKEYQGLVHQWKKYRLQAYEMLCDLKKQRELTLEFLYGNEYLYYSKLKNLYHPNEWGVIQQEILKTFEKQPYPPSAYVEILKEEKFNDKLLEYCMQHVSSIQNLYPYLIEDYFEEVNELFKKYIESVAEQASDRKKYKNVCSLIKTYKKVCGDINAHKIIGELIYKYKRKPAFVDELGKLK